ncbi:MAG: nicotinate (nicotinamide) nucleotide adenylyltransferase [Bacteroidia bacterium]
MHIGLFFGSFNPVHVGHLIIAEAALNHTDIDRCWMIVSPQNPFKKKANLLSEYNRLRMAELGIGDSVRMKASNIEFRLPKPSYTIDTLTYLREKYPNHTFSLIMGQDNLVHFHKWKNYEAILKHYNIIVYPRGKDTPETELDNHPNVSFFKAPLLDISATYIRETIRSGKSIRYLVPEAVREYLEEIRAYEE